MTAPAPRIDLLFRLPGHLAALLAVLVLAVLPPGVMPNRSADGGIEMVLCSDEGAVTVVLDPVTGELRPKPDRTSAKPGCDWAMAQALADLGPEPLMPAQPLSLSRRAAPALENDLWRPAHDPRGLYARGPPLLT